MVLQYVMRAFKTTAPTGHVYWSVVGAPDTTGAQSGYNPSDLSAITVDYSTNTNTPGNPITPAGLAGGDLGGTYPNPSVVKLQGVPVKVASPSNGQVLTYNNSDGYWEPITPSGGGGGGGAPSGPAGGDLSGTYPDPTVSKIRNAPVNTQAYFNAGLQPGSILTVVPGAQARTITINTSTNEVYIYRAGYQDILRFASGGLIPDLSIPFTTSVNAADMLFADGSLWLSDFSGNVYRIDPSDGNIIATISITVGNDSLKLAHDSNLNKIWVACNGGTRIDSATNAIDLNTYIQFGASALIIANNMVVIGEYSQPTIHGFNLSTGMATGPAVSVDSNGSVIDITYDTPASKFYAINNNNNFYRLDGTTLALETTALISNTF